MVATSTDGVRNALAQQAQAAGGVERSERKSIGDLIKAQRSEIARALPKHMDADRLGRIALTTIKTTPRLLECTSESLLGSLMLSAQSGLEPGPLGHVYFVPRKIKGVWECQWMLGYKGIIDLARRSGQLLAIEAREVCERDDFEYEYGLNEKLEHRPFEGGDRGPVTHVWGLARFKDGGHYFVVMSRSDIELAKARSDAAKAGFGPWITDFAAMARKTVIRRMAPYLPLSAEMASVIAQDETVHKGVRPNMADEPAEASWIDADAWEEPASQTATAPQESTQAAGADPTASEPAGQAADEQSGQPDPAGTPFPDQTAADPMTEPQSKALHALLRAKFGAHGLARFPILSQMLAREITSTKEITKVEASVLIDELQSQADQ